MSLALRPTQTIFFTKISRGNGGGGGAGDGCSAPRHVAVGTPRTPTRGCRCVVPRVVGTVVLWALPLLCAAARRRCHRGVGWGGGGRGALEGGRLPSPPLQGAQPMPSRCLPDGKRRLQWHFVTDSNHPLPLRQPPPTACLTASGAASEAPCRPVHPWGGPNTQRHSEWHRGGPDLEDVGHGLAGQLVGAVEHVHGLPQLGPQILRGLGLARARGPGRGPAHLQVQALGQRDVDPVRQGRDHEARRVAQVLISVGGGQQSSGPV